MYAHMYVHTQTHTHTHTHTHLVKGVRREEKMLERCYPVVRSRREGERERERERGRERERERERESGREREGKRERERERERRGGGEGGGSEGEKGVGGGGDRETERERHRDRETEREREADLILGALTAKGREGPPAPSSSAGIVPHQPTFSCPASGCSACSMLHTCRAASSAVQGRARYSGYSPSVVLMNSRAPKKRKKFWKFHMLLVPVQLYSTGTRTIVRETRRVQNIRSDTTARRTACRRAPVSAWARRASRVRQSP